ncbi:hypothetical protein K461DRAFT_282539 [Myriangium duriaei CBS 260.36]|uniref:Uncharacterized protein n=1 Tax=Myriangium duriaei CBS 260.36 TaxID=1168546 RepID=A0A9P4MIS3_9PEZI|nr:hypothetical protein K461DRAFT_282539 [Myriangium duriaei CBS 260.36]
MIDNSIDLEAIGRHDSGQAKAIDQLIQAIVNGDRQISQAAQEISKIVIKQSEAYFTARSSDPATEYSPSSGKAGPAGWQEHIWDYLGRSSMVIPVDHPGHASLVSLLLELQKLPKSSVRAHTADGEIYDVELWTLTKANHYSHLQQDLWQLAYLDFQSEFAASPEDCKRFVNYSAFLARLLAAGVVDTTRIFDFTTREFRTTDPTRRTSGFDEYETRVAATAQWVFQAGPAVFEMCEKSAVAEPGGFWWTRTTWENMKTKFNAVAGSSKYTQATRDTAARAVARMEAIEREGVTTDVVGLLEFHAQAGAEDDEENEDGEVAE